MEGRSNRGLVRAGLALTVLASLFINGSAGASTIRRHHLIAVNSINSLGPAWARFLSGGIPLWDRAAPPRFPSGLVLPTSGGRLVETPFVDYLSWRRSLDPARFDFYHPNIAPELGAITTRAPAIPSHVTTGVGATHIVRPAPQNLPEPGTFWIALSLMGAGVATRVRISVRTARAHC